MKIIIAVHHFPPNFFGGAELRAYRTALALIKRGHTVKVVAIEKVTFGEEKIGWEDSVYKEVPVRRLSLGLKKTRYPISWDYNNRLVGDHIRNLFVAEKPDIFHLFGGYLITASVLENAHSMGLPTIVSLTDYWFLCSGILLMCGDHPLCTVPIDPVHCVRCMGERQRRFRIPGKLVPGLMDIYWRNRKKNIHALEERLAYLRKNLNQSDVVISPSQFLRQIYIQGGIRPDLILYSRQGRDHPVHADPALGKTPEILTIGYLGQIAPHKGVHVLLDALRFIKDLPINLEIYGDIRPHPGYSRGLHKKANHDKRIHWMGLLPSDEINHALYKMDAIIVPSIWYENSPNTILDAFAHNIPVIASNMGGMAELVHHGVNGLLFAPADPRQLAAQIKRLITEPDLLARLREGIQPVKDTTQEINELEAIYRQVLCKHSAQPMD